MALEVILHLQNEDPILAELESWPDPTHQILIATDLRRRDGRPVRYLTEGVTSVIFPWTRITFVEVMETEEAQEVVEFFRE
ncbi:MAG: hypothetical protein PVF47_05555 [Anaerolineae bacterium]|jgi:hypothetical protein